MKLRRRFFILGALGVLFVVIAPLIIGFALGYRFDFAKWRLVETGTLMVRSEPRGASIFLNGEKQERKTPAVIRFLLPGEYDLRIEKENYQSWEKHFSVLPEQVTVATPDNELVYLFLSQPAIETLSNQTIDFFYGNNQIVAVVASSTLSFENFATKRAIASSIPYSDSTKLEITVSTDNNWAFVREKPDRIKAISLSAQKNDLNLNAIVPNIVEVQSFGKSHLLLLNKKNELLELDTETGKLSKRKSRVNAFAAQDNQLYFIDDAGIFVANKASTTLELLTADLSAFTRGEIVPTAAGQIFALLDKKLFSLTTGAAILHSGVEYAAWEEKSKILLFGDQHSLWISDPQTGDEPVLIIRSESPITDAQINFQTGMIFFQQNQKIKAVEIEATVSRKVVDLFSAERPVSKFFVDPTGQRLYVLTDNSILLEVKIR